MSKSIRTFVAVEITSDIRGRATRLISKLQGTSAKVRWVEPENLHWTLKFLGNLDLTDISQVCHAVAKATAEIAPFRIEALGAGAFPSPDRPRTVWIGAGAGSEEMVALHDAVQLALADLGFREEHRRFRPHMTLGRVRNSPTGISELGRLIEQESKFSAGSMEVSEVVVFASKLERDGPKYEELGVAELNG